MYLFISLSVYWFISLLLASSTVRISFALRTSTSRPFFVCSVPRGIPRFSFFCSPALNAGFSLCIFRASLREPPCPRCLVRASSASWFVLRSLAPHFMRVSLSTISYLLPSTGRSGGAFYVHSAMENCLDLAIRTGGAAWSDAPTQTFIRLIRLTGRAGEQMSSSLYKYHTHAWVCIV